MQTHQQRAELIVDIMIRLFDARLALGLAEMSPRDFYTLHKSAVTELAASMAAITDLSQEQAQRLVQVNR